MLPVASSQNDTKRRSRVTTSNQDMSVPFPSHSCIVIGNIGSPQFLGMVGVGGSNHLCYWRPQFMHVQNDTKRRRRVTTRNEQDVSFPFASRLSFKMGTTQSLLCW